MGVSKITRWQMDRVATRLDKLAKPVIENLQAQIEAMQRAVPAAEYHTIEEAWTKLTMETFPPRKFFKHKARIIVQERKTIKSGRWSNNQYINPVYTEEYSELIPSKTIDIMRMTGLAKKNLAIAKKRVTKLRRIATTSVQAKAIDQIRIDKETVLDAIALEGANYAQEALVRFEKTLSKLNG